MLQLTDQQLAHLVIAASAVPQPQRRRWLKQIADKLDGDKAKQTRRRMQRCRAPSPSPPFLANPDCIGRRVSAANPFANISASVRPSRSAGSRFGQYEDRTPPHGYPASREAAMAAFAKSWRRELVGKSRFRGQTGKQAAPEPYRF